VNTRKLQQNLSLFCALACAAVSAQAVELNGSGFLTMAVGKMLDSNQDDAYFVGDYGQAGIYEHGDSWKIGPDSKLGLQGSVVFNPQWSATGQVVARGAREGKVNLEWLYGTYNASDNLTIQFGQKRLPLFYFSESQDVGFTLPWIRLPPEVYGWDVVNFQGANMIYRDRWGDWNATAELAIGNEKRKDNPYQEIYAGRHTRTDEEWTKIVSVDLTLSGDWLETRFSYMHSDWATWDPTDKANTYSDNGGQSFYSVAAMADYENWVVRSELSYVDRPTGDERDWAAMLGVGYRFGKWLPMITYGKYHGNYIDPTTPDERWWALMLSLRYDLSSSSALKIQYDMFHDQSDAGISSYNASGRYGDSRILTIAYEKVF
jgi:hypothetical protein